jgi:hypothetical protein
VLGNIENFFHSTCCPLYGWTWSMDESCTLQIASDWLGASFSLEPGILLPAPETPLNAPWNMPNGRIRLWINWPLESTNTRQGMPPLGACLQLRELRICAWNADLCYRRRFLFCLICCICERRIGRPQALLFCCKAGQWSFGGRRQIFDLLFTRV